MPKPIKKLKKPKRKINPLQEYVCRGKIRRFKKNTGFQTKFEMLLRKHKTIPRTHRKMVFEEIKKMDCKQITGLFQKLGFYAVKTPKKSGNALTLKNKFTGKRITFNIFKGSPGKSVLYKTEKALNYHFDFLEKPKKN